MNIVRRGASRRSDHQVAADFPEPSAAHDVDVRTINYHLKKVFSESELEEVAVIRNFRRDVAQHAAS